MKVSFVYDDGYVIQLQVTFRIYLQNGVPLHGKRSSVWQPFLEKGALEIHGMVKTAKVRFLRFIGSPYKNYHHGCGYFTFVRFLSVAWPYNCYTHNLSLVISLVMISLLKYTASLPHVH